jgi:UDP-N-acetylglucosamine 1-carboxyvinyltransferase
MNIMIAAVLAEGRTIIENAAREPHIVDLANFLNSMGADVRGAGTDTIKINGVEELHGGTYTIIPDQIEAGTYMVAAAATGGEVLIKNIIPKHMEGISAKLRETGTVIEEFEEALLVKGPTSLRRINLKTMPYPGFPTDMQPQFGVLLCLANGTSVITEGIYDNRFKYVNELRKMGAEIQVDGRVAVIDGGRRLTGAPVHACDLRAGAAMVIAGMVASGVTEIDDIHFIERGYERFVEKLNALGADIQVHYDEEDSGSARAFSAS